MAFVLLSPGGWALLQVGSAEGQDWWRQEQGTQTRTQRLQPENSWTRMLDENIDFIEKWAHLFQLMLSVQSLALDCDLPFFVLHLPAIPSSPWLQMEPRQSWGRSG